MIDIVMALPPLHLVFDRTKWNGDMYNSPYEIKSTTGYCSHHIKRVNPPNPLGRHPFNIITEEIFG